MILSITLISFSLIAMFCLFFFAGNVRRVYRVAMELAAMAALGFGLGNLVAALL
jgi:hypothetical protein